MRIPINVGVKGRVTATLTNMETGEKQEVKGDNLILDHYLDWAMTQGLGVLGTTTFNRCYIGNGSTPPQPGDTTFNGTQLAMSAVSELVEDLSQQQKAIPLNIIEEIGVGNTNSIAITPDENIMIIGSTTEGSRLRAFKINHSDWTLTELQVPDFAQIDFGSSGGPFGLSCGGDYLFVGMDVSPYGKLFKRSGDSFIFVSDASNLSSRVTSSNFSSDGKYLLTQNTLTTSTSDSPYVNLFEIDQDNLVHRQVVNVRAAGSGCFFPDSHSYVVVGGIYTTGSISTRADFLAIYDISEEGEITEEYKYTSITTSSSRKYHSATVLSENEIMVTSANASPMGIEFFIWNETDGWGLVSAPTKVADNGRLSLITDNIFASSAGEILVMNPYEMAPARRYQIASTTASKQGSLAVLSSYEVIILRLTGESLSSLGFFALRQDFLDRISYSRQWTFPAGTGTGTINRVGLQANSGTGAYGNNRHVAQIVLLEPLEKTDLHQLNVIWEIEVENPGVWEGVITGGSRDGSDLAWRVTINEEQFYDLVQTGYRIPANWFGVTGTPNVRIGTSNEESDLIFDRQYTRGEEIEYISSTAIREVNPYVSGSLKRTIRLFLEINQGIGQIGEMVLGGSTSDNSLARITFDPPLDKPPHVGEGANPYRLYLDLEIGWQRGE